jgi:hypothetical protein
MRLNVRLTPLLTFLIVLAGACSGGSDGDSGGGGTSDPKAFATKYILTSANVFSGEKSAQDLINLYTPKCREGASKSDIEAAIKIAQTMVPKVKGVKFEDADFGAKFEAKKTSNGFDVTIPGTKDSRIKINGNWGNAHDKLVEIGLEDSRDGSSTDTIALEMVDGQLLASDCDALRP